jgi:deazaflavin-dependent oxidoreductase (nitroreductase family)
MSAAERDPNPNSNLGAWIRELRRPGSDADGQPTTDGIDAEVEEGTLAFAAAHARRYVASAGADDGWDGPRPIILLYTRGRRTGKVRRNPLLCFEHDGSRYVIGSLGGAPRHPVWYLNLVAEPRVHVRFMDELYEADARTVTAEERAALWPHLVGRYPMFGDYQSNTEREIPIVQLQPVTDR